MGQEQLVESKYSARQPVTQEPEQNANPSEGKGSQAESQSMLSMQQNLDKANNDLSTISANNVVLPL